MKSITYKLIISLLFICANSNSIIAQESTYLDGKSYAVSLTPLSPDLISSSWKNDTFIFDSGEMYCLRMKKREGFKSAPYSPSNSGTDQNSIIKFTYENFNKYGSNLKIEGTAQGTVIEGTAIWTDDNGEHEYTFTGTLLSK